MNFYLGGPLFIIFFLTLGVALSLSSRLSRFSPTPLTSLPNKTYTNPTLTGLAPVSGVLAVSATRSLCLGSLFGFFSPGSGMVWRAPSSGFSVALAVRRGDLASSAVTVSV